MQARAERIEWVDTAKAICILLVVLYHARHSAQLISWDDRTAAEYWHMVNAVLKPIRMPSFFIISGFLAAGSLRREWSAIAEKRVLRLAWVYAVWTFLFVLLIPTFPVFGFADGIFPHFVRDLLSGTSAAWYLWALALFFYFAWVTRDWPWWAPIAVGAAIAAISPLYTDGLPAQTASALRCLVFFMVGIRMPRILDQVTAIDPKFALPAIAILAPFVARFHEWQYSLAFFGLFIDAVAAFATIYICAAVCRAFPNAGASLRKMSPLTLPIYILHFPLIVFITHFAATFLPQAILDLDALPFLFPLALTAICVPLSLFLHRWLGAMGGDWLFDLPRMMKQGAGARALPLFLKRRANRPAPEPDR